VVLTVKVERRLAALKSSTQVNGFQHLIFLPSFSIAMATGMVSNKITGFPIPESRQKSRSLNVSNRMMMGAVNIRF
jgi:cell division protein ZapA (FtsZ GTPase activity inhibitor)